MPNRIVSECGRKGKKAAHGLNTEYNILKNVMTIFLLKLIVLVGIVMRKKKRSVFMAYNRFYPVSYHTITS